MRERRLVKLLRFVGGAWTVVDYPACRPQSGRGIPELADLYTAMGYVVEY